MTEQELPDISMQADSLYSQEIYTDRRVGTVRKLTPVTASGDVDSSRDIVFEGQASLYTPAGALPLNFEIEAATFAEAIEKFGDAAKVSMEKTIKELEEMRRNQASGIVTPGGGNGGGKIQMP